MISPEIFLTPIPSALEPHMIDAVSSVYVINLDRAKRRWDRLVPQLEITGLSYTRFNAIDGRLLEKRDSVHPACWSMCTPGAMGVALSHIAVWKLCAEQGGSTLILEDDANLCPGFREKLDDAVARAPEDTDILLVGYQRAIWHPTFSVYPTSKVKTRDSPEGLVNITAFYGMHAYVITRKGAAKLVDMRPTYQIDIQLSHMPDVVVYGTRDQLAWQEGDPGDPGASFVSPTNFPVGVNSLVNILEIPALNMFGHRGISSWMACVLIAVLARRVPKPVFVLFFAAELGVGGPSMWWILGLVTWAIFSSVWV